METKPKLQTDPHYKVDTKFPSSDGALDLGMYIEAEDSGNKYELKKFNISKKHSGNTLNGLLIFLKKHNDENVGNDTIGYRKKLNLSDFTDCEFEDSTEFDKDSDKMLIILFHDNDGDDDCIEHDKKFFFDSLQDFYRHIGNNNYMFYDQTPSCDGGHPIRPRVAGMTIVRKSTL